MFMTVLVIIKAFLILAITLLGYHNLNALAFGKMKDEMGGVHCVKNVLIRSYSGPYFPAFGLNTERYGVSLGIQSECGENLNQYNSEYGQLLRTGCY